MGTLWLKDIRAGLDTRRIAEALPGGSAIRANDGHINRGGEFEQRPAFVSAYTLPAGATLGLAADNTSLYVFGSGVAPTMPRGVLYQRLQHPDGITPLCASCRSTFSPARFMWWPNLETGRATTSTTASASPTGWTAARACPSASPGGGIQPQRRPRASSPSRAGRPASSTRSAISSSTAFRFSARRSSTPATTARQRPRSRRRSTASCRRRITPRQRSAPL
jgi:hypothetical protein